MKIALVQRGPANVGKSSTIIRFFSLLRERFPGATCSHESGTKKEFRVVVTIKGAMIGIESLGDPSNHRQDESLQLFTRLGCLAIICASRTRGGTITAVRGLERHGYEIQWRDRRGDGTRKEQANTAEAKWMVDMVKPLLQPP